MIEAEHIHDADGLHECTHRCECFWCRVSRRDGYKAPTWREKTWQPGEPWDLRPDAPWLCGFSEALATSHVWGSGWDKRRLIAIADKLDALEAAGVPALQEEVERLRRVVSDIRFTHRRHFTQTNWCGTCWKPWPCQTARVVEESAALEAKP